ncbi:DUF1828 domain-containing protein [Stenotrophomonas sp. Marseille-Q5258]|uniref:DUF1828 domain-containing protein n=1 Tax=Stenotrophomonas sp. Marseille-Q5258 TaxID=2972779 RepID=UPI0021C833FE|nr:DUF1828 domain-containing protein [Stenotrophomonas sp. Marseille-Q5258]
MLTCQNLLQTLGWRCQYLEQHAALYVSTPILLPGGSPLDFYLTQSRGSTYFTDDGLTLFQLRSLGFKLDDNRSSRGVMQIAKDCGFNIDSTGAIVGSVPIGEEVNLGRSILTMFTKIVSWQEEHFEARDADQTLADEVEQMMRQKAPAIAIVRDPIVRLANGDTVDFMFRWGPTLVDAIPADARATSSRMRKAILVQRDREEPQDILYIVDDRQQPFKASKEAALLGQIAKSMRLTDFQEHYQAAMPH